MKCCEYGDQTAPIVLIQPVDERDLAAIENGIAVIQEQTAE